MESMLPEPTQLFFGIASSIIGIGYMAFGRKHSFYFMLCGMCLVGVSFFTFDALTYGLICGGLVIAPFILDRIL